MSEVNPATNRSFFQKIGDAWLFLIGNREEYTLEARIFHSICVALVVLSVFDAPYDFFAGLYISAISCVVLGAFFVLQYYNSRFRGKQHSTTAVGLTGIIIFTINYFSNSGINGSTDVIWPSYLLLFTRLRTTSCSISVSAKTIIVSLIW